ncbi:MAG: hypothetical protein IPL59_15860 [Candidatus Competibacteraceae bacterium]|nr:hypothetical protein [Candidatus Competibacteraceae bacterium]
MGCQPRRRLRLKFDQGIQATLSGHLNYPQSHLTATMKAADVFSLRVQDNTLKSLTFCLCGEISRTLSMSWGS